VAEWPLPKTAGVERRKEKTPAEEKWIFFRKGLLTSRFFAGFSYFSCQNTKEGGKNIG